MNKYLLGIAFFCFVPFFFIPAAAQQDSLSPAHRQIAKTGVFIVPPVSFEASTDFEGFVHKAGAKAGSLVLVEMGAPFEAITAGLTEAGLAAKGIVLKNKAERQVANQQGLLLQVVQPVSAEQEWGKYILAFGDEARTTFINASYPLDSLETGELLRAALATVKLDTGFRVSPRNRLPYEVDETLGNLNFASYNANSLLFTRSGEVQDELLFILSKSLDSTAIDDLKSFSLTVAEQLPGTVDAEGMRLIEIDGMEGWVVEGKGIEPQPYSLYFVLLTDEAGGYYIIYARYPLKSEQDLRDIQRVARSFKRK